jgi:4-hydroxy-2-oxoheptanedioate aldolase
VKDYRLKQALRQQRVLVGMSLATPAPALVEVLGRAGYDYVFIDYEHSSLRVDQLPSLVRAAELTGLASLVRVSANDPTPIRRVLEDGADGVIIPHVNSRDDAQRAVRAAKFPPDGIRGVGTLVRANTYGFPELTLAEYTRRSNDGVAVIVLIEEEAAVTHIDEIVAVEGVDVILLGPADLSTSLGLPGQYRHPRVVTSIAEVMAAAQRRGTPVMCAISYLVDRVTEAEVRRFVAQGLRLITFGSVEGTVKRACLRTLEAVRGIRASPSG